MRTVVDPPQQSTEQPVNGDDCLLFAANSAWVVHLEFDTCRPWSLNLAFRVSSLQELTFSDTAEFDALLISSHSSSGVSNWTLY